MVVENSRRERRDAPDSDLAVAVECSEDGL